MSINVFDLFLVIQKPNFTIAHSKPLRTHGIDDRLSESSSGKFLCS